MQHNAAVYMHNLHKAPCVLMHHVLIAASASYCESGLSILLMTGLLVFIRLFMFCQLIAYCCHRTDGSKYSLHGAKKTDMLVVVNDQAVNMYHWTVLFVLS